MKAKIRSIIPVMLVFIIFNYSSVNVQSQTNVSVTTATLVNSFPYTETNVNSSNGGTASGMNGACSTIPCCSLLVYRVETPSYGSLRVDNSNFSPLGGSIIAYTPDNDNPQDWSDLTYFSTPGNFCGFRDSLQLGYSYSWTSNQWIGNPDINNIIEVTPPGTYYVLLFNHNNQAGYGANSDFTFQFAAFCPTGCSCSSTSVTLCDGDGYSSPSGNLYTTSGSYQDTLFGAASGGLDSLIFTNLTINHTAYTQDLITDETLCLGTDTLKHSSYTDRVSYANFVKADDNWIECNNVVPSLVNTNRSIFGWMKKSTTVSGSSQMLVGINTSGTGNICNLQIGTNEQLGIYDGSNSHYTGVVVTDGNWHYVGYTYDETTDSTKMYVDGVMEGKYKNSQSIGATSDRLSLGQEFDGSTASNLLDGLFTEVSIWNEVLDSAEIALIMNEAINSSHPKYANLKAYYPMMTTCSADNLIINDYSGNNNYGNASYDDIQILDDLEQITGFNSAPHYNKNWTANGSSIATSDSLIKTTYVAGNYELELNRDYFTITDDWVVTLDPNCSGGCTETTSTINPTACDSYTSPSGNYSWTSSNTYMDTLTNAAGCDSVITINLTVNYSTTGTDTQTACDTYTWIDGNTYTSSNTTATHTLTNAAGCDSVVTLNLTINNSVINNAAPITACDSAQINGNWYNTSQTVTDVFTGGAANGCDSTVITPLTIQQSPTASAGSDITICEDAGYTLSGAATNQLSILWTTNGDGLFDDATLLAATYTPGVSDIGSGSVDLTITAYSISPCATDASDDITISIQQLPTANAGADATICEDGTYTLIGTASDQQNTLWTTAGDGIFDDASLLGATYTPGTNDISNGTVDLTLTAYSITPCATNHSDDITLTIQYLPEADAGADATICETGTYTLSGVANFYQSVLWSTAGDGTFDDATILTATYTPGAGDISAGTVDITLTSSAIAPCATDDSDDMTLTIQELPTADAGTDATICEDAAHTLTGAATNDQSVLWTTSGDGTFDDASLLGATYTPGANDITNRTATLTLTAYAITPCAVDESDDMVLTIQGLPTADAGVDATICEDVSHALSGVATNYQTVLWTTAGDGSFDDATLLAATYTPGASDIGNGTVDLTLTSYAITPCATDASDYMTLTIQELPTADAGADATICEDATHTLAGAATNDQSVLWTTSGDGTFDDATSFTAIYTPGVNDITNGFSTLTLTSYSISPCATDATDNMILTIQGLPTSDAGADATICEDATYTLTGAATNYQSVLWTTSGDGTFDDPTLLSAIYTPGLNDITNGSANLTLTSYSITPCATDASDYMTLLIQQLPTSNAGDDAEICENESHMLNGSATNHNHVYWATSGDGEFDDRYLLNATYTPGSQDIENGEVILTMFAYAILPCYGESSDDMTLTIINIATASAGDDDATCETAPTTLDGEAENNNGQLWTTAGDGSFDDAGLLDATYTPGPSDISNGEVELTLTAYSNTGCSDDAYDSMVLTIVLNPEAPGLPQGPTAIDLGITSTSEYTIDQVANATSYQWYLEPLDAGTISGDDVVGTAEWNQDYVGLIAQIYVRVENDYCEPLYSETLEVGLSPVGVTNPDGMELEITISPNPSNGKFSLTIDGSTDDIELFIVNSSGQVIQKMKLINTVDEFVESIDISRELPGTYYLKFITNKGVITKKVIISEIYTE